MTLSLKSAVRYSIALGPKALVLLQLHIPLVTWSVVNVSADVNDFHLISLDTSWVSQKEVCLPSFDVVNCLLK